ncbi:MAG: hypothetical protein OIF32_07485 [Campylobacterales bacterium]|nr:hypothetical protein [Campylobacterales bacterium]
MIFGKIDYINLLPFLVFMKKNLKNSSQRMSFFNKKGVPSKINKDLAGRRIDAAFISSIRSQGRDCIDLGIVAQKNVNSVLVIPGDEKIPDPASETSNALADILGYKGEVIIGDRALKAFYEYENDEIVDLAQEWNKKYNLPFVFARLCVNKHCKYVKKLQKKFLKQKIKIPMYILTAKSKISKIDKMIILEYLELISYELGKKEKKSLQIFLKSARISQFKK